MLSCAPHWTTDPIAVSTVVIAVATVVNMVVSALLWVATKRTADVARQAFEAANRPYVGVKSLKSELDADKRAMVIEAAVENFGTVPAEQCDVKWEAFFDGIPREGDKALDPPTTLFPTDGVKKYAIFREPSFSQIVAGEVKLQFVIRLAYKGPGDKAYRYSEKSQYDPSINRFFKLGAVE